MALYGVTNVSATTPNLSNVAGTVKTMLQLTAQTTGIRRAFIYEWKVGASAVPNVVDCEIVYTLIKQSTLGTGGTTMTSNALDPADSAAATVATASMTAEPTGLEPGVIDTLAANQRGTYRWCVAPGGPGELVIPATNVNGIGLRALSSTYRSTINAGFMYRE